MNTQQNETGGKDLLLKVATDITASVAGTSTFTSAAHGLKVGDVVVSGEDEGTSIDAGEFYFVTEVPDANTFKLALTPGGSAITVDATDATIAMQAFKTIAGLRAKSLSFQSDAIDITSQDSDQYSKILAGAGIRKLSVSGEGVFTNDRRLKQVQAAAFANDLVELMIVDVKSGWIFEAHFKVTSLEMSGAHDGEGTYSISAESSGEIKVAQPA